MTGPFSDHFSRVANDYATYRPQYPAELFAYLASLAPARSLAWDCAAGSGQATLGLAPHFDRVIGTDASSAQIASAEPHPRVEYRVAAADANPYVILSAAVASGLWGIENKVEPEPVVEGNAYDRKFPQALALPRTLWESAQRLKASKMARDWFGDEFVDHFAATREWEEREFRRHITDWEMARYFEII